MTLQDVYNTVLALLRHEQLDLIHEVVPENQPYVGVITQELIDEFEQHGLEIVNYPLAYMKFKPRGGIITEVDPNMIDPDSCEALTHHIYQILNEKGMDVLSHLNEYNLPINAELARWAVSNMVDMIDKHQALIARNCLLNQ